MSFRSNAGSPSTGASTRKKILTRKKTPSSMCCKIASATEFAWNGRFCRKAAHPLVRRARSSPARSRAQTVKAITAEAPRFEMCPGLLEIRFYAAKGVPAYAYGPGLLSVAHGPNEYVDLRKAHDCAALL